MTKRKRTKRQTLVLIKIIRQLRLSNTNTRKPGTKPNALNGSAVPASLVVPVMLLMFKIRSYIVNEKRRTGLRLQRTKHIFGYHVTHNWLSCDRYSVTVYQVMYND